MTNQALVIDAVLEQRKLSKKSISTCYDHTKYMGIRPDIEQESYDEIVKEANSLSPIPITNFQDAITIVFSEYKKLRRSK